MLKTKKFLKTLGLLLALPALLAGVCLWAIRPLAATRDEVEFTAVDTLGTVWIPLDQVPSGKVVTVEPDLHQLHTQEPVDEDAIRNAAVRATEKVMDARYGAQIASLETQIDEMNTALEEANAALDRRKADEAAAAKRAEEQKAAARKAAQQAAQKAKAPTAKGGGSSTGGQAAAQAPTAPGAAATPAAPQAAAVDAGTLIANGHAYAASKNMGVNGGLSIGSAGYFNPVDISALTQEAAQSDIYYCIDQIAGMMGATDQDHPPVYNIVQSGNLIYVLYG